ncbi:protein spire homolog 2 isoform X5 [Bos indicus]|uniref:Spire type actin nucleation factor 2 n=2 Tax=Bos TaxID=9903 RepID=A0A4W2CAM9_BOBOX|nr:protein spire homolog 2 [Bos taurus]XP_027369556.1 protein spire homolog 2 isoform X5 [Bos indicus x Bos taurus]XP_059732711.1 protein spire homolog 2 isoform X2 [Bos taurus]XP_061243040.1 protein spire homolog 2 isoform X2 [Bos javanicus]
MARAGSSSGDAAAGERAGGAGRSEPWELSLEEVLKAYEQPINEEQAWAVCFQCCRGLRGAPGGRRRIRDTADILLRRDGSVSARRESGAAEPTTMVSPASSEAQVVQSLGFAIYRALDWGLAEHEERELSPQLERLIDLMANSDCDDDGGGGTADEGYGGPEEEEEAEGGPRTVRTFAQAMRLCAARLTEPRGAQTHYQAVCRALFVETLELRAFLARVREAKEMLQRFREDEPQAEKPLVELDSLRRTDWARLWVQLMRELRHGVKLKKVQEQEFNPLPTEFQLTPFEMLMQDIRARNYKLRKVMVDGDIPPRVKKDAHELILDFIRSRPPLKQVSERRLRPLPQKQRTLHEKILEEIKQERRLRPVESRRWDGRGERGFGSLPCILNACSGDVKSTSCINLSITDVGSSAQRPRPRVLLKAPTLAEMEEMNTSEEEESPCGEGTLKRDRSFSEHDLVQLRSEVTSGLQPAPQPPGGLELSRPRAGSMQSWRPSPLEPGSLPVSVQSQPDPSSLPRSDMSSVEDRQGASAAPDASHLWLEFSHPVESLALTVEEVMDVRRVLVKAEMEKFLQNKELFSSLKKGKICCCCRAKFPLLSWPPSCLFCKRAVCNSCSIKMKMPSKKFAHIPVYTLGFESPQRMSTAKTTPTQRRDAFQSLQGLQWRNVEEEFPHMYTHGCVMKDVCSDCTGFVADVVHSSRRSVEALNTTPRRARQTQSLYVPNTWTLDLK